MRRITVLFSAAILLLTFGIASAGQDQGTPWQEKETAPLLKSKHPKEPEKELTPLIKTRTPQEKEHLKKEKKDQKKKAGKHTAKKVKKQKKENE